MTENPSTSQRRDQHSRWLIIVIWCALLVTLVITSYAATQTFSSSGFLSSVLPAFGSVAQILGAAGATTARLVLALVSAAFAVVAIALVLAAWLRFVSLSRKMIVALAWLEQQTKESTLFSDMLILPDTTAPDEEHDQPDLDDTERTLVSDIVRYVGFAWLALIAMSPVALMASALV
jgi:hypothetical protein